MNNFCSRLNSNYILNDINSSIATCEQYLYDLYDLYELRQIAEKKNACDNMFSLCNINDVFLHYNNMFDILESKLYQQNKNKIDIYETTILTAKDNENTVNHEELKYFGLSLNDLPKNENSCVIACHDLALRSSDSIVDLSCDIREAILAASVVVKENGFEGEYQFAIDFFKHGKFNKEDVYLLSSYQVRNNNLILFLDKKVSRDEDLLFEYADKLSEDILTKSYDEYQAVLKNEEKNITEDEFDIISESSFEDIENNEIAMNIKENDTELDTIENVSEAEYDSQYDSDYDSQYDSEYDNNGVMNNE